MGSASEAIPSLQPVTFRYKTKLDPKGARQFGLVAEEVAKVSPDLVMMDEQGKPFTVRYDQVNAMLLNEFIKAHRKLEQQEGLLANQNRKIDAQQATIDSIEVRPRTARGGGQGAGRGLAKDPQQPTGRNPPGDTSCR